MVIFLFSLVRIELVVFEMNVDEVSFKLFNNCVNI